MKIRHLHHIACTFGLLGAMWTVAAQPVKPLRLGWIGPLTGPSADFGLPMLNGAKLAVDEINAAGGYLGRPLELVIKDDTANPDVGLQRSQELIKEQVVASIGFCNTGVAMKSLDVFQTVLSSEPRPAMVFRHLLS
jgi:branched-chain amino acid transport system substrate-binding protein